MSAAQGQHVITLPGMAIVHYAAFFALIRKGMVDILVPPKGSQAMALPNSASQSRPANYVAVNCYE